MIERSSIQTTKSIQSRIGHVIIESEAARNAGSENWQVNALLETIQYAHWLTCRWRPLEATLAAIGSQSESVLDCIEDETDSGRPKPLDIDYLLATVIPPILSLSGSCVS